MNDFLYVNLDNSKSILKLYFSIQFEEDIIKLILMEIL